MKSSKPYKNKKIVVIGGGTGTYTVLTGLKKNPVDISVVVSMMDSGGSNRVIRDEFGFLPTSDIRQCIVALASEKSNKLLRDLFTYRYNAGTGISGMTFGNLFMAALTDLVDDQQEAIKKTCEILDVKGNIIPVTHDDAHLVARYENGNQVLGEHAIDEPNANNCGNKIVELEVFPPAQANKRAIAAIKNSDLVVLGPGDLYTSILPNLVVNGISKALKKTKAKIVFVMNLMTRYGQTDNYKASDHIKEIEKYLGRKLDYVLINKNGAFPEGILKRYEEEKAYPVEDDILEKNGREIIRMNFVGKKIYEKSESDKLTRSLIRHDSEKLAKVLVSL